MFQITDYFSKMKIHDTQDNTQSQIILEQSLANLNFYDSQKPNINLIKYKNIEEFKTRIENDLIYGVPNLYCTDYFDDEDFIYNFLCLPDNIINILTKNNTMSIFEYVFDYIIKNKVIIDFKHLDTQINASDNDHKIRAFELYTKTIYIYQYIYSFYNLPLTMSSREKISTMPIDLFQWISNLIEMIKININIDPLSKVYQDEPQYLRELVFGMNVLISHIKMILNHHRVLDLNIYNIEEKYIEKFFRTTNNLCTILIYLRITLNSGNP